MEGPRGSEEVRGAVTGAKLARRSPPFLSRERAAVCVHVDPERCRPDYHKTSL